MKRKSASAGFLDWKTFAISTPEAQLHAIEEGWIDPNLVVDKQSLVHQILDLGNPLGQELPLSTAQILMSLIEHKADMESKCVSHKPYSNLTLFQRVAWNNLIDMVEFLAQRGANWEPTGEICNVLSMFVRGRVSDPVLWQPMIVRVLRCGGYSCQPSTIRDDVQVGLSLERSKQLLSLFDTEVGRVRHDVTKLLDPFVRIKDLVPIVVAYLMSP